MIRFSFFTGDMNFLEYGGKWLSNKQESSGREHYFLGIELINWEDAQGEPGPEKAKYNLSLVLISHPLEVSQEQLRKALEFCGFTEEPSIDMMVGALWDYGAFCPVEQLDTNNWREGMRQLRRLARELDYEAAMDRPVNRIGSTGREYLEGDFLPAVTRGLAEGRKDAWILAKMHGAKAEELEAAGFPNPFEDRKKEKK